MTREQENEAKAFGTFLRAGRGVDPDRKPNSDWDIFIFRLKAAIAGLFRRPSPQA